jgi:hypothetical protein
MNLLRRFSGQGRNVSNKPTAQNYAPTEFQREEEAKKCGLRKAAFEQAMRDLFKADRIVLEDYGRPSRPYSRLVAK